MKNNLYRQRGSILLTTVLFSFILMMIVMTLTAIFLPKIRTARDVRYSTAAIYTADSAMEFCLYVNGQDDTIPPLVMNIGSEYSIFSPDNPAQSFPDVLTQADACALLPLRATGRYKGVTRTLEITLPP